MEIIDCPHCGNRIAVKKDGTCPSCQRIITRGASPLVSLDQISPPKKDDRGPEAARQIGTVIRIFKIIGWPFSILMAILLSSDLLETVVLTLSAFEEITASMVIFSVVQIGILLLVTGYFVSLIIVANKLKDRSISARGPASALCCFMLIGFPLFTIIGAYCLYKLNTHYLTYCRYDHKDH